MGVRVPLRAPNIRPHESMICEAFPFTRVRESKSLSLLYFVPALVILECFFNLSQGFAFDDVVDDADHEGGGVVEGFFDFEFKSFMDDAFHSAWGYTELFGYGFVVDVFDVFMSDGLTILFAASLFGQQSFDGFPKEVDAVLVFVAFCFDKQCSSCSFIIDEGSLTRVVVIDF